MPCLICNCDGDKNWSVKSASSSGLLAKHLKNVFLLRKVLEVPADKLKEYLEESENDVGEWFEVCATCAEEVDRCWVIWEELMEVQRRFKESQWRVVEVMRNSLEGVGGGVGGRLKREVEDGGEFTSVVWESRQCVKTHNYGEVVNPFIEGDLIAKVKAGELLGLVKTEPEDELQMEEVDNEELWGGDLESEPDAVSDWEDSSDDEYLEATPQKKVRQEVTISVREETMCLVATCSKPFSTHSLADQHMRDKHTMEERRNGQRIKCRKCDHLFVSYQARLDHETGPDHQKNTKKKQKGLASKGTKNQTTTMPCSVPGCLAEYSKYWDLDKHLVSEHTSKEKKLAKKFECPKCSKLILTFGALYRHCSKQHPKDNNLVDQACLVTPPESDEEDEDFDLEEVLYQSGEQAPGSDEDDGDVDLRELLYQIYDTKENSRMAGEPACADYSCLVSLCTEAFSTCQALDKHLISKHTLEERKSGRKLECRNCGKQFLSYQTLFSHTLQTHPGTPGEKVTSLARVVTGGDSKGLSEEGEISPKRFQLSYYEAKPCLVPTCSETFGCWNDLSKHMRSRHTRLERQIGWNLECSDCGKLFQSYNGLSMHCPAEHGHRPTDIKYVISKRKRERPYRRMPSQSEYPSEAKRRRIKYPSNHGRKKMMCPFCNTFRGSREKPRLVDLCLHLDTCRKEKYPETDPDLLPVLLCPNCEEFQCSAKDPSIFVNHWMGCRLPSGQLKPEDKIFSCDICRNDKVWKGTRFFVLRRFLFHFRNHQRLRFECVECGEMLQNTDEIYRHWLYKHESLTKDGWSFEVERCARKLEPHLVPGIPWWCPECDIQFSSEDVRDDHVKAHHLEFLVLKEHRCRFCGKEYACDTELNIHQETTHVVEMGKLVACNICEDQYFSERKQVLKHLKDFHKDQMLRCFWCPAEFGNVDQLSEHLLAQHQSTGAEDWVEPRFQCATCGKFLQSERSLQAHVDRQHKGVASEVVCHLCGKSVAHKGSLKRHIREIHLGDKGKEYPCSGTGCKLVFPDFKTRRKHFNECHSEEKKTWTCELCGLVLKSKSGLIAHRRFYHSVQNDPSKLLKCKLCDYVGPSMNSLKRHGKAEHPTI